MPQTKSALLTEVIGELSSLGTGQPASADQIAFVESRIVPIISELSTGRIITIANIEAIPDYAFPDLVRIVAEECAPKFRRATDKDKLAAARASLGQLARLDRTSSTALVRFVLERLDALGGTTAAVDATAVNDALQSVLDDLSARRIITIANPGAVTSAAQPHIVTLAAARVFPKAATPQDIAVAEQRLRDIVRLDRAASPFVVAVLEQLQILGAGSTPFDATSVQASVQSFLDELTARDVIYVADMEEIEGTGGQRHPGFNDLARYIAANLSAQPIATIQFAEDRLSQLSRPPTPTLKAHRL